MLQEITEEINKVNNTLYAPAVFEVSLTVHLTSRNFCRIFAGFVYFPFLIGDLLNLCFFPLYYLCNTSSDTHQYKYQQISIEHGLKVFHCETLRKSKAIPIKLLFVSHGPLVHENGLVGCFSSMEILCREFVTSKVFWRHFTRVIDRITLRYSYRN